MNKELSIRLRNKVNESKFIFSQYRNIKNKNKWNCICSAMDWIDVGVSNIELIREEFVNAKKLEKSIRFYNYITCIDMIWEAIQQLYRVLFNTKSIPLKKERLDFKNNIFDQDDNQYFKTIRACFGEHSVNLYGFGKENERKFSSWSFDRGNKDEFCVYLYSNILDNNSELLSVNINEIDTFFERRYNYLDILIEQIEQIDENYTTYFNEMGIEKVDNPLEQIEILIKENRRRTCSYGYESILNHIKNFFDTSFISIKNKKKIEDFKKKLIIDIQEIRISMEKLSDIPLVVENLVFPPKGPYINQWRYEFIKLYEYIFCGGNKFFCEKIIVEPLKKYVEFEYNTYKELYWLVIIALNIAQDDLKYDKYDEWYL